MRTLSAAALLLSVAAYAQAQGQTVWVSRSVLQRTTATCKPNKGTTVRAYRNVDLDAGVYTLYTTLTQRVTLQGNCDTGSSSVVSDMLLDGDILINKRTFVVSNTCKTTENDDRDFQGNFELTEPKTIRLTFETTGGDCARVEADWQNLSIIKCAGESSKKLKKKLNETKAALKEKKSAKDDAGSDSDRRSIGKEVKALRSQFQQLKKDVAAAENCEL